MSTVRDHLVVIMWGVWGVYWWVGSWSVKRAARSETLASRASHLIPLAVAAWLLLYNMPIAVLNARFLPATMGLYWIGVGMTAAGLLFSVWGRVHLGRNWSGTVTIKEGHELISTGPYALVRHPLYTGLLLAFLGTTVALGKWRGLIAVLVVFASLWRKLSIEERWLVEQFGDTYVDYRKRVKALIPFVV